MFTLLCMSVIFSWESSGIRSVLILVVGLYFVYKLSDVFNFLAFNIVRKKCLNVPGFKACSLLFIFLASSGFQLICKRYLTHTEQQFVRIQAAVSWRQKMVILNV